MKIQSVHYSKNRRVRVLLGRNLWTGDLENKDSDVIALQSVQTPFTNPYVFKSVDTDWVNASMLLIADFGKCFDLPVWDGGSEHGSMHFEKYMQVAAVHVSPDCRTAYIIESSEFYVSHQLVPFPSAGHVQLGPPQLSVKLRRRILRDSASRIDGARAEFASLYPPKPAEDLNNSEPLPLLQLQRSVIEIRLMGNGDQNMQHRQYFYLPGSAGRNHIRYESFNRATKNDPWGKAYLLPLYPVALAVDIAVFPFYVIIFLGGGMPGVPGSL